MLTLIVSHNIGLTKEERYKLHNGETIDVVGVSVPVWLEKGTTSEPANEVFVKYKLTNIKKNQQIKTNEFGYEINIPQINTEVKEESSINFPNSKNLLDIKDGGIEFLEFKQYSQSSLIIDGEKTNRNLNVVHSIEIRKIEEIINSLESL